MKYGNSEFSELRKFNKKKKLKQKLKTLKPKANLYLCQK